MHFGRSTFTEVNTDILCFVGIDSDKNIATQDQIFIPFRFCFTKPKGRKRTDEPSRHCTSNGTRSSSPDSSSNTECCDENDDDTLSITDITGPTALLVDAEGTWKVDVENDTDEDLSYSVTWGDEGTMMRMFGFLDEAEYQSSASFTHAYDEPGTYTPLFTVKNESGETVSMKAATVTVSEVPAVSITSLSAVKGYALDSVTITGTGFSSTSDVYIGTTKVDTATVTSSTSITFTVPTLATGTYAVTVKNDAGTSNSIDFTVIKKDIHLSISGIDAPIRLDVNEEGTWKVNVRTNATGTLHYQAIWGDEGTMRSLMSSALDLTQTSSTFTHSYATAGTYEPKFIVTDDAGNSKTVSAQVVVTAP